MTTRFRFLAALLALFAFAASTAEGVWAAACQAEMEVASVLTVADVPAPADHCTADGPAAPSHGGDKRSDAPHCPLGPVGNASCIGGTSFPAELSVPGTPLGETATVPPSTTDARNLLLASAFFRPPRA